MSLLQSPAAPASVRVDTRPRVQGKFIFVGSEKLYVRGVTYGTFRPDEDGNEYHDPRVVDRDFMQMAANGINAVRTYTVPPRWFLDCAGDHDLRVMVGLPWEQHVAFLDNKALPREIEERVRAGVRACAGHPAVLCYAIGNEIPTSIVRWHGKKRTERFLHRLYRAAKAEDPGGLVTYVNYPSTEYLDLSFLDFFAFNVYLESQDRYEAYLARLQNIAGDRPLVVAEIGLDSRRNGEDAQARSLDWQVRAAFATGCAGAFVFAWTDEWHRGGHDIDDWDFGLVARDRRSKPALEAVRGAFADAPFPKDLPWPPVSVVVCTYNGSHTIRDTLDGCLKLEYPDCEVIVVNDGSTDGTGQIVAEYPVRLLSTPNQGLSSARNTGLAAARGEIVAYIDADARPDPHWLMYLAATFLTTDHAGVGGPNIAPSGDGSVAECVANAPGGPAHVLLSDREAEHIPGCNMAFRKAALEAIDGFDPQFRAAGDDVDLCWRLHSQGWTIGFSPAAMVWHHRRNSIRAYWKQQVGYGKAESLLERKWPEKYNAAGHLTWAGRLYGTGLTHPLGWFRQHVYGGAWGSAPFQSVYKPAPGVLRSLPLMPEWYFVILALADFAAVGMLWRPLLYAVLPLLVVAALPPLGQAGLSASRASFMRTPSAGVSRMKLWALTAMLHLVQPLARLHGRLRHGLTPWRRRGPSGYASPWPRHTRFWTGKWRDINTRLHSLEEVLCQDGSVTFRAGDYDRWDLEVRGGALGAARLLMVNEDHAAGVQLVRVRSWPRSPAGVVLLSLLLGTLAIGAALSGAWPACAILLLLGALLALRALHECGAATAAILRAVSTLAKD